MDVRFVGDGSADNPAAASAAGAVADFSTVLLIVTAAVGACGCVWCGGGDGHYCGGVCGSSCGGCG